MPETIIVTADLLVNGRSVLTGAGFFVGFVAEVLELYVEVSRPEDVAEVEKGGVGVTVAVGVDEIAHLAVSAAGEADEPLGMGTKRLEGDERRTLTLRVG